MIKHKRFSHSVCRTIESFPAITTATGGPYVAVYRSSEGNWYLQRSLVSFGVVSFGIGEDIPSPGDYDGDGKTDVAVFRPSTGV